MGKRIWGWKESRVAKVRLGWGVGAPLETRLESYRGPGSIGLAGLKKNHLINLCFIVILLNSW